MKVPEQEPAELPPPLEDDAEDPGEHLLSTLPEGRQSAWGNPVEVESKEIERYVRQLQGDLQLVVSDLKRGTLARLIESAHDYLGELRREFLRHHRRLVVQVRTPEGCAELSPKLHSELAELAERFRSVALGRSSWLVDAWQPNELVEVVDRAVDSLPDWITAPLEQISFDGFEGQGLVAKIRRIDLRAGARFRRWLRMKEATREVRLRELSHHHLADVLSENLESIAVLFVRLDVELASQTRRIFERIAEGFESLLVATEAELPELVQLLRTQVEEDIASAEKEVHRLAADITRRAVTAFGDAMSLIKTDLPLIGTFDLPHRKRPARGRLRQRERALGSLEEALARARDSSALDYSLLGLQLEFIAFESRARDAMENELADLEADVRGRSHVQLERVQAALQTALKEIGTDDQQEEERLHQIMDPVERVLGEALRVLFQLNDQLEADQAASPLLDALMRQAQTLTDRYRVPSARMVLQDSKLPPPLQTIEVPLRELVSAYLLTDVAPRVLQATNGAAREVQPLLAFCQELERIVTFNTEAGAGEGMALEPDAGGHLQQVVLSALDRRMDALSEQITRTDVWASDLSQRVRTVVTERLTDLRHHLAEGRASGLRLDLVRIAQSRKRLLGELDRVTTVLDRLRAQATGAIRGAVGEERLRRWKVAVGIGEELIGPPEAGQFAPPEAQVEIPIVYRRLFAAQAHWAGDVLHQDAVKRAREHLAHAPGLRAVAVVGLDASRKVAIVSAISRGERFGAVHRIAWKKPATLEEVEKTLADLPRGHLIVVTGLRWLLSARPGGFDPLRRFVEGIIADGNQNAWLLESGHFVWEYAARISPIASLVTDIVRADPLSPTDLENAVLARHHLSAYQLVFVDAAGNEIKAGGVRAAIQDQFFLDLHEASGGLLHAALVFWIASIVEVDESAARVKVARVPASAIPRLRSLAEEDLLTLFQIARQGWMDGETLAFLFRTDLITARAKLVRLANLGLLERAHRVYQVPTHLRGGVVQALLAKGWLQ